MINPILKGQKVRIVTMAILLGAACFLTYYFHAVLGTGVVFTHFFYIPIILASLWWKRKGLLVAIFLSVVLILSHIIIRPDMLTLNDYFRAPMFIVIAVVVAILSERITKSEEATKLAHSELQQIFNTAADGMCVIDKGFKMLRVNESFWALSGLSEDGALGKKCYEVFHGPLCRTPDCPLTRILGGEERVECEIEKECNDGTRITCIVTATPFLGAGDKLIGIVEDFKDITERKRAEEELREAKEFSESIISSAMDGIAVADLEGKIIQFNDAFVKMLGYSGEELKGMDFRQFTPEKWLAEDEAQVKKLLQGIPVTIWEKEFTKKDGSVFPVTLHTSLLTDEEGKPTAMMAIIRDETERKSLQERLLGSERLATLGQFSGNISHELRNPLGVIDSSAYYLKTKLKDADEKVHEHLDRIKSSVGSSTAIIESLLNLTRMKEPQLAKLNLIDTTSDAIATSKVPATLNVIQSFPEQEVLVNADHEQLRMAFKNIIKNAVEAMDGKGTLTVTVGTIGDNKAEVSFADTGPGITPEDLDRVFQPLFSTKAKGIGFGLSIAKMVVDKHGGTIEAKSEPGKGATIVTRLPVQNVKIKS